MVSSRLSNEIVRERDRAQSEEAGPQYDSAALDHVQVLSVQVLSVQVLSVQVLNEQVQVQYRGQ
jgi:hypothetical protein